MSDDVLAELMQSFRETPEGREHWRLVDDIMVTLPSDFAPWGLASREDDGYRCDCSCGCRWYRELAGDLGDDWGVCTKLTSPRRGLLTFEHQGGLDCFEPGEDNDGA